MVEVGFSTGSLYKHEIPLEDALDFYKSVGATAVELSFGAIEELKDFRLTQGLLRKINGFNFVSFHAPFRDIIYGSNEKTKAVLEKLSYLNKNLPLKGIVIHPDLVENPYLLMDSKLPILLENMNLEKASGKFAFEFKTYHQFGSRYVLDIEHAYGNDSSMQLTNELMKVMGRRLNHLHVSGKKDNKGHILCCLSENKAFIEEVLKNCQKPRISEGILPSLDSDLASREIEYLKRL